MLVAMAIGIALMFLVMLTIRDEYSIPVWKVLAIAITGAAAGYLGTSTMSFIESGDWTGRSFFGAIFFAPIIMIPIAYVLKLDPRNVLDLSAPCELTMLFLLKIKCKIDGCCYGRIIIDNDEGVIRFPSQIVEAAVAFILVILFIVLIRKQFIRDTAYPWYMILYGLTRFILNLFRETTPFIWILPAGNFWSIISILIGAVWIMISKKKNIKESSGLHK